MLNFLSSGTFHCENLIVKDLGSDQDRRKKQYSIQAKLYIGVVQGPQVYHILLKIYLMVFLLHFYPQVTMKYTTRSHCQKFWRKPTFILKYFIHTHTYVHICKHIFYIYYIHIYICMHIYTCIYVYIKNIKIFYCYY